MGSTGQGRHHSHHQKFTKMYHKLSTEKFDYQTVHPSHEFSAGVKGECRPENPQKVRLRLHLHLYMTYYITGWEMGVSHYEVESRSLLCKVCKGEVGSPRHKGEKDCVWDL